MQENITQKFSDYLYLDAEIKEKEAEIKKQKSIRFAIGKELINHMNNTDITKIAIKGQLIYIRKQLIVKIENKELFFTFLEQEGEDDIIKRVIHPRTLNSWIKDRIEEGLKVSDHVIVDTIEQIGVRKV